jgi:ribosome-associated protein
MEFTSLQIVKHAVEALQDKKGNDIQVIEVGDLTVLTEYFVLCSGTSTTQIKTLADAVEFQLKQKGNPPIRVEGYQSGNWIAVDFGSVIVHVFHTEMREFYNLERVWADGKKIDIDTL